MFSLGLALHLSANLIWIGSIVGVGLILGGPISAAERGKVARWLYLYLATPAFALSLLLGLGLLLDHPELLSAHYMHAKLLLAVVVIGLHHVIGARARKMAAGASDSAGPAPVMAAAIAVCAVAIVILLVYRPF